MHLGCYYTRCKWQSVSADHLCLDHLEQMLIPEVNIGDMCGINVLKGFQFCHDLLTTASFPTVYENDSGLERHWLSKLSL